MKIFQSPDFVHVEALLKANQLPTADLLHLNPEYFFGYGDLENPVGVIGLEAFSSDGLLRSLVVDKQARGSGCGKALVHSLETFAHSKGIQTLYLLTETAEAFFLSLGYREALRNNAPEVIRQCREFSGLCSEDAILMSKAL